MRGTRLACCAFCFFFGAAVSHAATVGTAFTYQGRLSDGGNPANGLYDLQLVLYNSAVGGTQQGPTITTNAVGVANGLFVVTLDFAAGVFDGTAYWLGISVRTNGTATLTPLSPRQPLSPAPYALFAPNAGIAANA